MLDLAEIRARVALAQSRQKNLTVVDIALLTQAADEIESGRRAAAELERMRSREGMTFGRNRPTFRTPHG